MANIWYRAREFHQECITSALEAGISIFLAEDGIAPQIRALAKVTIAGQGGDLELGKDYEFVQIKTKADEEKAALLGLRLPVILETPDWEIIPIENLIAAGARVYWTVPDATKAKLAFEILEKGVEGIVLDTTNAAEIRKFASLTTIGSEKIALEKCEILQIENVGMGDRVCVDTATYMNQDQGILAGNSSGGMLLVQSESNENPYVASRPFRVNLSAVHAYTPQPQGKTTYLSELKAGKKVIVVNRHGQSEEAIIGRIKMEKRPMLLVTFRKKDGNDATVYSLLLQNAETVRLFKSDSGVVSVANLNPGDIVLGTFDEVGRHFGMKVKETIQEK